MRTPSPNQTSDQHPGYYLNNVRLEIGENIELWTTHGWEIGRFEWRGEAHLPYLDRYISEASLASGNHDEIVITAGMPCRRLANTALEPVRSIEVRRLK